MYVVSFFTDSGIPKIGLTPTITIIDISDNSTIINAVNMAEVSNGFYKYNFTAYNDTKDYAILSDGGATLENTDRYIGSSNELFSDINDLDRFNKSSMLITGTILRAYDSTGTIQEWDLKDSSGDPANIDIYHRVKK